MLAVAERVPQRRSVKPLPVLSTNERQELIQRLRDYFQDKDVKVEEASSASQIEHLTPPEVSFGYVPYSVMLSNEGSCVSRAGNWQYRMLPTVSRTSSLSTPPSLLSFLASQPYNGEVRER
jgi:hypothetical protein